MLRLSLLAPECLLLVKVVSAALTLDVNDARKSYSLSLPFKPIPSCHL